MLILEAAMWTPEDRALVGDFGSGQALSDDQYRLIEPFIPPPKPGGRPRTTDMRLMLDGLFYVVRTGCQPAAAPGISAVADSLWLFSNFPGCGSVGDHPPLPGHDAARDRRA